MICFSADYNTDMFPSWKGKRTMSAEHSTPFLNMATRIDRAERDEFGGALVLVSPDGKRVEFFLSNPSPDVVAFWGFVKSSIEDAFNEYQNTGMMQQQGWPRR